MWSLTLAAATVAALAVGRTRPRAGWALHLSAQALWCCYAVATAQWGFLVTAGAWALTYARLLAAASGVELGRTPPAGGQGEAAGDEAGEDVGGTPQR